MQDYPIKIMQFPKLHLPQGSTGKTGEDIACDFLRAKGYRILARNFRTKIGELDIICHKAGAYIFVEVKTLQAGSEAYSPELHFTPDKLRKMQRAALMYFKTNRMSPETNMQFDLLCVELDEGDAKPVVRQYENLGT